MPLGVLADVAGEDRGVEGGERHPHRSATLRQGEHRRTERDLDDTGGEDDDVLVHREPVRHLRLEVLAGERQVRDTGERHEGSEAETGHLLPTGRRRGRLGE